MSVIEGQEQASMQIPSKKETSQGGPGLPVFHNCPWYLDALAKLVESNSLERSFDFEKFKSPEFKTFFDALD